MTDKVFTDYVIRKRTVRLTCVSSTSNANNSNVRVNNKQQKNGVIFELYTVVVKIAVIYLFVVCGTVEKKNFFKFFSATHVDLCVIPL